MANPTRGKQVITANQPARNLKRTLILTGVTAFIVFLVLYIMFRQDQGNQPSVTGVTSSTENKAIKSATPEISHLVGRWLRPDGGYILEIRSATPEGKLDVGYYNPKSINVGRAEWVKKDGKLYVMAELQDVNYPGSIYGLEYQPATDHLVGTYYQAVEKSTFDVQFVREK